VPALLPLLYGPTLSVPLMSASLLSATVQMNPDARQIPGSVALQDLANGIGGWALIASMVGVVIGAVMWAFGHYSQNYQQAYNGRRGVVVSALAATLIGGAPYIVRFMLSMGTSL
jgi:type IV secretory pathway VirB2 component (pilin)